jgi:hypothetical protein
MVWAALTIILMQGVLAIIGLACVRSFGAFTSSIERFTSTFLAAHTENAIMRSETADLVDRNERTSRRIERATEVLYHKSLGMSPGSPPDQEKSA